MSKNVFYVGIDVGSRELWVSVADQKPRPFAHSKAGLENLCRWARRQAGDRLLHLCLEASGVYSISVATGLFGLPQTEVSVVNAAQIAAFAKAQLRRCKSDPVDAEVIRAFAESQHPLCWQPASKAQRQLAELVQLAEQLQAQLQQWRNRRHAHHYLADLPELVGKTQKAMIRSLKRQLEKVERAIAAFYAADPVLAQQVALLSTIPGVAQRSAIQILASGQNWLTERSAKALTAHSGLAPHPRQSGTSLNASGTIDKRGNRRLRKALYMPTLVAIQHNPRLKTFYRKLCQRGKPKMVAIVACMKKLLLIIRAILKNKTPFNYTKSALT